jgi:hypothetical protein
MDPGCKRIADLDLAFHPATDPIFQRAVKREPSIEIIAARYGQISRHAKGEIPGG